MKSEQRYDWRFDDWCEVADMIVLNDKLRSTVNRIVFPAETARILDVMWEQHRARLAKLAQ